MIHVAIFEVESAVEQEFKQWYEQEHVPKMLERPGWRRMRRYRCTDGAPYASLYELDDDLPLRPFISEAPFRDGPFVNYGVRNYHARTWREISARGDHLEPPEWLNIVSVDVDSGHAEAFNRWYDDVHVPEILTCPGWHANRRYECLDGEPRYLAIYDLEDSESPFNSPEWRSAAGWDEHVGYMRGYHGFRVYRLIHCASA